MIQTCETDPNLLEASFYEKPLLFSFSSLSKLLTSPKIFYKEYILGEKDKEFKKYFIEGSLIHFLILENHHFDDKFLIMSDSLPSANTIKVIERIYNEYYLIDEDKTKTLEDYDSEIDQMLIEENLHQTVKDYDKRIGKIIDLRSIQYFDFLKKQEDKIVIDAATLDLCTHRANILKQDPEMRNLLGMDIIPDGYTTGVYNELSLEIPSTVLGKPFGIKGILDNMVIDAKKKIVRINDFKTTGKSLTEFTESVKNWKYWLQAAIYHTLVKYFLRNILTGQWKIEFRFIVFDKYNQFYPFEASMETMEYWLEQFDKVKEEATYHYELREYNLPYDYALKNIKL